MANTTELIPMNKMDADAEHPRGIGDSQWRKDSKPQLQGRRMKEKKLKTCFWPTIIIFHLALSGVCFASDDCTDTDVDWCATLVTLCYSNIVNERCAKTCGQCNAQEVTGGPENSTHLHKLHAVEGAKGDMGDQGANGTNGIPVPTGEKGDKGEMGESGTKGDPGPVGMPGVKGRNDVTAEGAKGQKGAPGLVGINGNKGDRGVHGITGPTGQTGATGPRGITGPQGRVGKSGPKGQKGVNGAIGLKGRKGDVGPSGIQGPTGNTGIQGNKGEIGPMGPKGYTGSPGVKGQQGVPGAPGIKGSQGVTGPVGITGSKGASGFKGATGITGRYGTTGAKGRKGERGNDADVSALRTELAVLRQELIAHKTGIRLVGGNGINSGRVEINHDGIWGTICDDSWDTNDGNVICRSIGYTRASSAPGSAHFGQGTGKIWLDDVACTGYESKISSCTKSSWGTHDCGHGEDASVVCA